MRKRKAVKKSKSKLMLVALKMLPAECRAIRRNAKRHAQGNFSAWVRHASLRYRPKRGEVIKTVTMPGVGKKKR